MDILERNDHEARIDIQAEEPGDVDGNGGPLGTEEGIVDEALHLPVPTLVVGTGLGPVPSGPFLPSCAPEGENHEQFYDASGPPAWHVVAVEYGHQDMLDDETPDCGLVCSLCPAGPDRIGMRTLSAGLLTAFFRASLQGVDSAYEDLSSTRQAPVQITVESR